MHVVSVSVIDDERCGSVGISRPRRGHGRQRSSARFPTGWGTPASPTSRFSATLTGASPDRALPQRPVGIRCTVRARGVAFRNRRDREKLGGPAGPQSSAYPADRSRSSYAPCEAEGEPCARGSSFPPCVSRTTPVDDARRRRRSGLQLHRGRLQRLHRPVNVHRGSRMETFELQRRHLTPMQNGGGACCTNLRRSQTPLPAPRRASTGACGRPTGP